MARAGGKSSGRCRARRRSRISPPIARAWSAAPRPTARSPRSRPRSMQRLLTQKLAAAEIAFAPVNDVAGLARHPHLRRITVGHAVRPGFVSGAGGAAGLDDAQLRRGAGARRAYRKGAGGVRQRNLLVDLSFEWRSLPGRTPWTSASSVSAIWARTWRAGFVEAGHRVFVYDTRQEAIGNLAALGAVAARSPAEVADAAETVMASLPTPDIVLAGRDRSEWRDRRQARPALCRSLDHRRGDGAARSSSCLRSGTSCRSTAR